MASFTDKPIRQFHNGLAVTVVLTYWENTGYGSFTSIELEIKPGQTIDIPEASVDEYECMIRHAGDGRYVRTKKGRVIWKGTHSYEEEIFKFARYGYLYHGYFIMYEEEKYMVSVTDTRIISIAATAATAATAAISTAPAETAKTAETA